jgi:pimeloyl-ACP methyl ester carboxylesterase
VPHWTEIDWTLHLRTREVLGRRLQFVDYGEGPPLVLVHGLGGCWQWWLENIPTLGRSHRVIAVDLPGFGASEPLPPPGDMETHAETILALLDALAVDRASIAAHSMGGLIAVRLATGAPDRLVSLVLVCAGGIRLSACRLALLNRVFRAFNAAFARRWVARAFALRPRLRRRLFARAVADPEALRPELAAQVVPLLSAPGFLDALASGIRVANHVDVSLVQTPTLALWGRYDPILPVQQAKELVQRMPEARLEVLEASAHCPMFEQPSEFNAAVLRFLSAE